MTVPVPTSQPPIRVGLIFGGSSSEHGVSCLGAAAVAEAIDNERYELVGIGITRSGQWRLVRPEELLALRIVDGQLPELPAGAGDVVLRGTVSGPLLSTDTGDLRLDVAMIMMHGPGGEDGSIQGLCDSLGLPHTGSGVAASAVGMDKHLMKLMFTAAGIPVGPFVAITPQQWLADRQGCLDAAASLTFPVFVKPARGGSSQGISRVSEPAGLEQAIAHARQHDPKVIVEQGFVGVREIECGVLQGVGDALDGGRTGVSVLGEVVMHAKDGFYDYESKYTPGDEVSVIIPAQLDTSVADRIGTLAREVFAMLGCEGLARVDVFVTTDSEVLINEVNTLPGFTATSMFPQVWQASGVSFSEQITMVIEQGLSRGTGLR